MDNLLFKELMVAKLLWGDEELNLYCPVIQNSSPKKGTGCFDFADPINNFHFYNY